MHIVVNGSEREIESGLNILSLLAALAIDPGAVVVELNGELPARDKWGEIILAAGDRLEIVRFMGGG